MTGSLMSSLSDPKPSLATMGIPETDGQMTLSGVSGGVDQLVADLVEAGDQGIVVVDGEGRCLYANAAARQLLVERRCADPNLLLEDETLQITRSLFTSGGEAARRSHCPSRGGRSASSTKSRPSPEPPPGSPAANPCRTFWTESRWRREARPGHERARLFFSNRASSACSWWAPQATPRTTWTD